ncbi:hypothetical protein B0T25DRAFT_365552 [Lasiosphaeria hispida]|uniref:Uncharacterized protein n=1 Tax=Lasiosphaeria hispida TaxID=260671 RepID=A0AAJ0M7W5_9PEZI|nr:hypothetical protein B0T25DRAFT_365552 [Lasiosphaeria hispida]
MLGSIKGPCVPVTHRPQVHRVSSNKNLLQSRLHVTAHTSVRIMLVQSFLLPLLVALPALASPPSHDSDSDDLTRPKLLKLPVQPECPPVNAQLVQCPEDRPCDNWCRHRTGHNCFKASNPIDDTFAILSSVFGFQAPINVRLCPIGKCDEKCLCRETLLKRLTALLLDDRQHESEKDEL